MPTIVSGVCPPLKLVNILQAPYYSLDFLLDPVLNDLVIQPDGSYGMATSSIKLTQDIKLFLLSPVGTSIQDPTWGDPVVNLIGQAPFDFKTVSSIVYGALTTLQNNKQQEQQRRGFPLEGTELIGSILQVHIEQVTNSAEAFNVQISLLDGTSGLQNINTTLS